jgi:hypothetical protein
MQQKGPLMIKRTLDRSQKYVEIVFDYALQKKFHHFPQCSIECKFSFSQDYNEIAAFADSFVTDKPKGILINGWIGYNTLDAALHFTKVVMINQNKGKPYILFLR